MRILSFIALSVVAALTTTGQSLRLTADYPGAPLAVAAADEVQPLTEQEARLESAFQLPNRQLAVSIPAKAPLRAELNRTLIANTQGLTTAKQGIYSFPFDAEEHTGTQLLKLNAGNFGAVYAEGKFLTIYGMAFGSSLNNKYDYLVDTKSWTQIQSLTKPNTCQIYDASYDDITGKIYAYYKDYSTSHYYFGTYDLTTSAVNNIVDLGTTQTWSGVAAAANGTIYILKTDGTLGTVNKTNGEVTVIGSTDAKLNNAGKCSFLTFDYDNDELYAGVYSTTTSTPVYKIDKATGASELYVTLPNQVVGAYFPPAEPDILAPAAPIDMTATFADMALNGKVKFTAPALRYNGSEATGEVTWTIYVNNEVKATGTVLVSEDVEADITLPEAGHYCIAATLTNAAGESPKTKIHNWYGPDMPTPIKYINVAYNTDHFTVSWPKVTTPSGMLDYSKVTYDVVRNPDNVEVATGISETSVNDELAMTDEIVKYSYTVTPKYDGEALVATSSDPYPLGHKAPGYLYDFTTAEQANDFTVLDANKDLITWAWNEQYQTMRIEPSSNDMDDWLLLPPTTMEGGKVYRVSFVASKAYATNPEMIAVYVGTAPTLSNLLTPLIPATEINVARGEGGVPMEAYFTAPANGDFTVGIYGCSPKSQWLLYIDEVAIDNGMTPTSPNAVTDLVVTSPEDGSLKATIAFTAPAIDLKGNELTELTKIEIYRNGELATTLTPAIGEEVSWTDEAPVNGINKYSIRPYGPETPGKKSDAEVFVGFDLPMPVTNVKNYNGVNDGQAIISWEAPTTDIRGRQFPEGYVTYMIERMHRNPDVPETLVSNHASTQLVDQISDPDVEQYWMQYRVTARTPQGDAVAVAADRMVPIGKPYDFPFAESFANTNLTYNWEASIVRGSWYWQIASDTSLTNASSHDGDNGYLVYVGNSVGAESTLTSGKFAIPADASNPTLSFWYCTYATDCENLLKAWINGADGERVLLQSIVMNEAPGWHKATIRLNEWKGQNVQLTFDAIIVNYKEVVMDEIKVSAVADYDMTLTDFILPGEVFAGDKIDGELIVTNMGVQPVTDFTVELSRGEIALEPFTYSGSLAQNESMSILFSEKTNPYSDKEYQYKAKLILEGDENLANNEGYSGKVAIRTSLYPAPTNLEAKYIVDDQAAKVTWDDPDMDEAPMVVTIEDCEKMVNVSTNLGSWKTVDGDQLPCGGIQGVPIENVNGVARGFFPLITADDALSAAGISSHGGVKALVSMYGYNAAANTISTDDWLISPELSGEEQTVTFYARSYHPNYLENIKLYISYDGDDIDDMELERTIDGVPTAWTQYELNVPAGAKYFAIRNYSVDKYILLVDDISYVAAGSEHVALTLNGYNVYRDGQCITDEPVATKEMADALVVKGFTHHYMVTALYDLGESKPSSTVELEIPEDSGVKATAATTFSVRSGEGFVEVNGAEGQQVCLYTIDGRMLSNETAAATYRKSLSAGIYLIRVADRAYTIRIK